MRGMAALHRLCALMLCIFANPQQAGVEESLVEEFHYTPDVYSEAIGIQNVVLKPNLLYLKSGVEHNALLRWDPENQTEDWSFSFTFNEPNLGSDEHAGIYLRYTDEKPIVGPFKGGDAVFNGVMIGLEFNGKAVSIAYAKNDGKDYTDMQVHVVKHDQLNPARFKGVETLTMKVISTSKNFKVEIYDKEKLLYDNFRLYDTAKYGFNKAGKHFGILADYPHIASGKAFVLHSAQLYHRSEDDKYAVRKSHVDRMKPAVREKHEIKHPNSDVKELIHVAELATAFIQSSIGELPDTSIALAEKELIKDLEVIKEKIEKLKKLGAKKNRKNNLNARLNDFDIKIKQIQRSINDFRFVIENNIKNRKEDPFSLRYIIFASGCLVLYILVYREILAIRSFKKEVK